MGGDDAHTTDAHTRAHNAPWGCPAPRPPCPARGVVRPPARTAPGQPRARQRRRLASQRLSSTGRRNRDGSQAAAIPAAHTGGGGHDAIARAALRGRGRKRASLCHSTPCPTTGAPCARWARTWPGDGASSRRERGRARLTAHRLCLLRPRCVVTGCLPGHDGRREVARGRGGPSRAPRRTLARARALALARAQV